MRFFGCICIFAAPIVYLCRTYREQRYRDALTIELVNGLESIASLVRAQQLPLPQAIETQSYRPYAGEYFAKVCFLLKENNSLQVAWESAFKNAQVELSQVNLTGDAAQLLGQINFAVSRLREGQAYERKTRRERDKLRAAIAFSLSGLILILLL